jgi:hypothetical protein
LARRGVGIRRFQLRRCEQLKLVDRPAESKDFAEIYRDSGRERDSGRREAHTGSNRP